MVVDAFGVLLAQMSFLLDLGEVGVEALLVALAVEGVHSALALPLLLPDLVVFDLDKRKDTLLSWCFFYTNYYNFCSSLERSSYSCSLFILFRFIRLFLAS